VNLNVAATETELTVVDLPSGSDWQFRVRAENAVGPGDWSPEVAVTIESTGTVPDQVAGVVVEGDDRALEVTWVEPADGGSPVLTYTVERRLFGTLLWLTSVEVPGDQLVHRFEGLVNGTNHEVRVRAVNVLGAGPWSAVVSGSPAP
jgi:hypothetical protein